MILVFLAQSGTAICMAQPYAWHSHMHGTAICMAQHGITDSMARQKHGTAEAWHGRSMARQKHGTAEAWHGRSMARG
eukprot:366026-Chlamydomonas_euryale.AAC.15